MGQTRINLKHLLEDIRDSYPCPAEETIVTELVANALDSGASSLCFAADPRAGELTVLDDGRGMSPRGFKSYHDIASSTKTRGQGIGFAGVGAKISLLYAESVYTETRGGRAHRASRWRLETPLKAPWRLSKPLGLVTTPHGTAVRFHFIDTRTVLLDASYLESVVRRHFLPLFYPRFRTALFDRLYPHALRFSVNGREMGPMGTEDAAEKREFEVRLGTRKTLLGFGLLMRHAKDAPEEERGIAVSTYGKVIKRGWDWLGLNPRNPGRLAGLVEVPALSALLTTNKADFLRSSAALKKYYQVRKAVLKALAPHLAFFGEEAVVPDAPARRVESQREIERALSGLIEEFPELAALLDAKRRAVAASVGGSEGDGSAAGEGGSGEEVGKKEAPSGVQEGVEEPPRDAFQAGQRQDGSPKPSRRKGAGLRVVLEERPERDEPAWLSDEMVKVNSAHPAFRKARQEGSENYHAAVAVAWALSSYLQDGRSQQAFFNKFLISWGGDVVAPADNDRTGGA